MKKLITLLTFLITIDAFTAVPTAEGLFRNGSNKDLSGNLIVLTFVIEEHVNRKLLDTSKVSESTEEVEEMISKAKVAPRYFKVILGVEDEKRIESILIEYNNPKHSSNSVIDAKYFPNILNKIANDDYLERELFYSVLNVLMLNDSRAISQVLKKHNSNFLNNEQLLNENKLKILNAYKNYLQTVKDDETLKETLENPLKSEDPEKQKEISEYLREPMYTKDNSVKLVRDNAEFFWKVDLEKTQVRFETKKGRMRELIHSNGGSTVKINFGEYILFDGIHELPKYIFVKDLLERVFKVQVTSYKAFNNTGDNFIKRYKKYSELVSKNKEEITLAPQVEGETPVKLFVY
ncbi:MAG: hypothetical protein KC493_08795 [Bacteriovoracaceae bacterium]|nr:hypothetical protein [Bacteriovoracaceae bacterium]